MSTRWHGSDAPRGDEYDARWQTLAARGANVHGEADLVETLLREEGRTRVLDAGCGTGRVAIELARPRVPVVGVDADVTMLTAARAKAPELCWLEGDLADLSDLQGAPDDEFDLIVLAGNVVIFLSPGTEGRVLDQLTARLAPGGLLVAGFRLRRGRISLAEYDRLAAAAGLDSGGALVDLGP